MKRGRFVIPYTALCAMLCVTLCVVLLNFFSCKAMPRADTGEGDILEDPGGAFGGYDYEGWDFGGEDDDPSLALPPGSPADIWSGDLSEPFFDYGEASLPDQAPEEAALVLAEPLPEPVAPDLPEALPPDLAEEPAPEAPPEESPAVAGEPSPEEPPAGAEETPVVEPPAPATPPPPPRIVRPSEPVPPPPPAREPVPMPPASIPDLPALNPPFTPVPGQSERPGPSSRVVSALAGQTVEVPFRGTGWVYLGEAASKRGLDYAARRLDGEGQTFLFRAVETGVYELKFYRQDFIRDYIINDLVTVIVEEPPQAASLSSRSGAAPEQGTVSAEPRWPVVAARTAPETGSAPGTGSPAPAGQAGSTSRVRPETAASGAASTAASTGAGVSGAPPAAAGGVTVPGEAPSAEAASSPLLPQDTAAEEYMRRAREEYQGERFLQSAAILEQFLERFPLGSDEAYWLYAQISEKQGPSRNIRLALDYYHRLVAEYPQSGHYNDARRRIAWLERYYINIQ